MEALGGLIGLIGVAGITDPPQFLEQLAQGNARVVPTDLQALVGQIEVCFGNAVDAAQVLLDQPAAGRAADAFDHQAGAGQVALMAHERLLDVAAVVQGQFIGERLGQRFRVGRGFTAVPVVALQAAGDDRFGDRLATRTAQGPRLAQHAGLEAVAGGDRQAAVIAGNGSAAHAQAQSPSRICRLGATSSSSNRRQSFPPSVPSSSTKRRPSIGSWVCPW